ncbi:unnamed protein product [Bursaphelenchus xylophilus]|uniref:Endoplasmic reticulum lectin 1 n=1 Tax=Bursaphelenchus xylophilus TaxID=6326 RepID=A0A1I7S791_BURXY|nr:unnamed protein product [Bursaphelenchus xylophilus]CAG9084778.1 unnamed protein product [Bursaphelenchus xylophilus]
MKFLFVFYFCLKVSGNFYFNDEVLFNVVTEGHGRIEEEGINPQNLIPIVTADNEKLKCLMPNVNHKPADTMDTYLGPSPSELVNGIYTDKACLLRIEVYWSYEICHGRYIRQFHEEKDSKQVVEFFLGSYSESSNDKEAVDPSNPPKQEINGKTQTYYPVLYQHGTSCDLTGQPRITTVNYVCAEEGMDIFYSLTEISTCVYEAIVGINELCVHPMYKVKVPAENPIRCFAAPEVKTPEPRSLRTFNAELARKAMLPLQVGRGPLMQRTPESNVIDDIYKLFQKSTDPKIKKLLDKHLSTFEERPKKVPENEDTTAMNDFWTGKACLYGGTGWWKYEFCYGHSVAQFHEEKGKTTKIMLGYFDRNTHKEWADTSPSKARKLNEGEVYQVSMFYSRGDVCKEANTLRSCEVRLTCRQEESQDSEKITMYLIEPETCTYVLVVESQLFCDPIQKAGKDGLFPNPAKLDRPHSGHIEL